jgi:hypothetical protein
MSHILGKAGRTPYKTSLTQDGDLPEKRSFIFRMKVEIVGDLVSRIEQ